MQNTYDLTRSGNSNISCKKMQIVKENSSVQMKRDINRIGAL